MVNGEFYFTSLLLEFPCRLVVARKLIGVSLSEPHSSDVNELEPKKHLSRENGGW